MTRPVIRFKRLNPKAMLPSYATEEAAGADVRACLGDHDLPLIVPAGGRVLVPLGLACEIPPGFEIQVRPRSGLALKSGVTVLNTPGTVDSDYRGPLGVVLFNTTTEDFFVNNGDRIAQFVVAPVVQGDFHVARELNDTERGQGGFGSTGVA